jgi:predicted nucleic acid-binding protein
VGYVLDTTGLIAHFKDEPEADQVEALLQHPSEIIFPFMTMMEARYVLSRTVIPALVDEFLAMVRSIGAPVIESYPEWGAKAARVKARDGLSIADAWIAALAIMHEATLVHKDPEFDRVPGLQSLRLG